MAEIYYEENIYDILQIKEIKGIWIRCEIENSFEILEKKANHLESLFIGDFQHAPDFIPSLDALTNLEQLNVSKGLQMLPKCAGLIPFPNLIHLSIYAN